MLVEEINEKFTSTKIGAYRKVIAKNRQYCKFCSSQDHCEKSSFLHGHREKLSIL